MKMTYKRRQPQKWWKPKKRRQPQKWGWPKNEEDHKNEHDLKNGDDLKNIDNIKYEDNIKSEDDLKNYDDLKHWPSRTKFFAPPPPHLKELPDFLFDEFSPWQPHHNWY